MSLILRKCLVRSRKIQDSLPCRANVKRAAIVYFTSGTSGPPKMVQHNAMSYPLAHTNTGKHWLRLRLGSLYWNLAEQGWAKAAWSYFSAWNCGAGLFVQDDRGVFSSERTLSILQKYPITTICAPPTVYRQLVSKNQRTFDRKDLESLVHCASAGEPLNPEAIRLSVCSSLYDICAINKW